MYHEYLHRFLASAARLLLLATSLTAGVLLPGTSPAQPYTPDSNTTVVATLPAAIVELAADLRRQQTGVAPTETPDAAQILSQAMSSYQVAASSGEARAYGRTLSILQSWPGNAEQPALYRILLAAVLQHNHEFAAALTQLQTLTASEDGSVDRTTLVQALMMQSQIGLVIGDYALVERSCSALRSSARRPVAINCQAQLDGVTGNAPQALAQLDSTLRTGGDLNTQDYQELLTTAAILAHQTGDTAQAQDYYQTALRLAPTNSYLLVNYSNLLLELDRHNDLIALLSSGDDNTLSAELSILLARALRARGSAVDQQRADKIATTLAQDFQLAFTRNDAIPHKEYAQYALYLADQPSAALSSARDNWALQKEPSDTRLLAYAATANNDQQTLVEVAQWVDAVGTQDQRLHAVLNRLRETTP